MTDAESGWRTIALEDDLLAAEAAAESEVQSGVGGELVQAAPRQLSTRETQGLFTPEETAQLKLTVLTSQNPDERIEAVRKLVFAPMDSAQKAGIFLSVLTDREAEPKVCREAVRSLEQIGFRSDMAEALRDLFQEDVQEAVYAIKRLGALMRNAESGEAALALAVVLEVFDQARDVVLVRELLELIGGAAGILVGNYQKTEQFCQSALRQLARDFDQHRVDVEAALRRCADCATEFMADLLWRELERTELARVRALLLNLIESLATDPLRISELARRAVDEILDPSLPESGKGRLRYALVRVGEPAVREALARMGQASAVERAELIRLVDVVCTESTVSDETVQEAVQVLLDLLKLADVLTRRIVLQAALLGDERVSTELRTELAGELLNLMAELDLPGSLDTIQGVLERIGTPALQPVYEFVRRSYPSDPAERAAISLGRIIEAEPGSVGDDLADSVLDLCTGFLGDENVEQGGFTVALAAVCGYTPAGAARFEPIMRQILDKLWGLPYSPEALEALGIMAGSDNVSPDQQEELFGLFDAIVRTQVRTGMGVRKETEDGIVYEFGRDIDFDIRVVPAAVRSLERICLSRQASARMRTEIVKRLLILWEGVSKVRIIWGPTAVDALVRAMCSAACSSTADTLTKVRLGASLLRSLNKISVVRSVGLMCSQPDEDPAMRLLMVEAGQEILTEWETSDVQDDERKLALLKSAGRIAANPALPADSNVVRRLRESTLEALYSGLREGMTQVREPLLLMRDCPDLPAGQRQEIDERLGKAFGLVRTGD